ncbi:TPA: cation:proton antiporter, partial [archaeon]|nr:cation:proton antiporter [Candidatus Naiadarchaeales archaeon SRR2090153.bin1042]
MASIELIFALAGTILLIGFLGYYLSRKFRIPDILILIFVGYIITTTFKLIDPAPLKPIVPLFTSLALLVILFDGGLQLELHKFLKESPRAFVLSVLAFVLSMLGVAAFMHFLLGWDLLLSLLLGSIIGDSSATVAIAMVRHLNIPERV